MDFKRELIREANKASRLAEEKQRQMDEEQRRLDESRVEFKILFKRVLKQISACCYCGSLSYDCCNLSHIYTGACRNKTCCKTKGDMCSIRCNVALYFEFHKEGLVNPRLAYDPLKCVKFKREQKRLAKRHRIFASEKEKNASNIVEILKKSGCNVIKFRCDDVDYYIFTDRKITHPNDTSLDISIGKNVAMDILQCVFLDDIRNKNAGPIKYLEIKYLTRNEANAIFTASDINQSEKTIFSFVPGTTIIPIILNRLESYGKKEIITAMLCINSLGLVVHSYVWEYIFYGFLSYDNKKEKYQNTDRFYLDLLVYNDF